MKTNTPTKTTRAPKLDLEAEPEKTGEEPLVEVEFPEVPDALERPSMEHRKEEASKPLYLTRYE